MYKELSIAALTENIPAYKFEAGELDTVVYVYKEGKAYEVEFVATDGSTVAVLTLQGHQIRGTEGGKEIMHVRKLVA